MNADWQVLTRKVNLEASGGNDTATFGLELGSPYRHLTMWVFVAGDSPNVNAQPKFGGVNDGSVVNITSNGMTKVFQVGVDEIRPPSRRLDKHPDDTGPVFAPKSELQVTNADAAPVELHIYILCSASVGGA